jgi:hypothetical protein
VVDRVAEQFQDGEVEIVWGREDIGCLLAEVRVSCRTLTEDDVELIGLVGDLPDSSTLSQLFSSPDPRTRSRTSISAM